MWWEEVSVINFFTPALYFGTYGAATGIERLYHRWVMRRIDRKRAWLERLTAASQREAGNPPPPPGPSPWPRYGVVLPPGWSYTANGAISTERQLKNTQEALKKLQSEVDHLRGIGNSVTVTKQSGVPATTPHVEDDPNWRWDNGRRNPDDEFFIIGGLPLAGPDVHPLPIVDRREAEAEPRGDDSPP